jgi:hypothetical protein
MHGTKAHLKEAKRRARAASTVEEQAAIEEKTRHLERRRRRQEILDVEDEIEAKRDALIAALERRLNQRSHSVPLFRIRWRID